MAATTNNKSWSPLETYTNGSGEFAMVTSSGLSFSIKNTTNEMLVPRDIAHALSLMCRANGHFVHFYSVAQHSLNCYHEAVARDLSKRIQLGCLLHDASEAYLGDLTRPVKAYLPDYVTMVDDLQEKIWLRFDLQNLSEDERDHISEIDDVLLLHEFEALHLSGAWEELSPAKARFDFAFRSMGEVEREFLETLQELESKHL